MKANTLKFLLVSMILSGLTIRAGAQDLVNTRVDVKGSSYSSQMWLYSVSSCTRGYDSGFDSFIMLGAPSPIPQIFAMEDAGNFLIDAIPNVDNTYLGFIAGQDTVYTLTFIHQNLALAYSHLYLIDSIAKTTTDIYANGSNYTFNAKNTTIEKRFKIVTSLQSVVVIPTVPIVTNDTTSTITSPPSSVPISDSGTIVNNDTVVVSQPVKGPSDILQIYSCNKNIVIKNQSKHGGILKVYNAMTGRLVKNMEFNSNGTTVIQTNEAPGTYVVYGSTSKNEISKMVMLK